MILGITIEIYHLLLKMENFNQSLTKKQEGKEYTIFSFRSSFRYNSSLNGKESKTFQIHGKIIMEHPTLQI